MKLMKKKKLHEEEIEVDENALAKLVDTADEDLLKAGGVYYITGSIEEDSLKAIHQNVLLKHLAGPKLWKQDLTFVVNSTGGSIDETNGLLDLLANIRMDIRTVGLGTCASAGAMLVCAGTKGKRTVGPNTILMVHCYSWGSWGKHHELVSARHVQNAIYEQELAFWIKHSKYTKKVDVEKYLLRKEDTWLTAKEAMKHGIVDHIGDVIR